MQNVDIRLFYKQYYNFVLMNSNIAVTESLAYISINREYKYYGLQTIAENRPFLGIKAPTRPRCSPELMGGDRVVTAMLVGSVLGI